MLTDPLFYAAAIPAVILTGLSKGGFGGAFGFAAVPLMALVISPVQAAGIMLPILVIMDGVGVWAYRRLFDRAVVLQLLPGGLIGTAIGWGTASLVSEDAVRLLVGAIALVFLIRLWLFSRAGRPGQDATAAPRDPAKATFWGTLAGYTSFVAHAGGPPFQTYVIPLKLTPVLYAGTSAIFFAIINVAKLGPYAELGQFTRENLTAVALMAPLAVASTYLGVRIVHVLDERLFYRVLSASIFLIAVKLIWDSLLSLTAS